MGHAQKVCVLSHKDSCIDAFLSSFTTHMWIMPWTSLHSIIMAPMVGNGVMRTYWAQLEDK